MGKLFCFCLQKGANFSKSQLLNRTTMANQSKNGAKIQIRQFRKIFQTLYYSGDFEIFPYFTRLASLAIRKPSLGNVDGISSLGIA